MPEVVLQPTPLRRPGSPRSNPTPTISQASFQRIEDREWPIVEEPPTGSAIVPLDAAMQVYFARLYEEWDWVLSERQRYDSELYDLNALERQGRLNPSQRERLTELRKHYVTIDNVTLMVEAEFKPPNAVSTVMTNLRMGIWEVTYVGSGIWRVTDGATGLLEYSERTEEGRRIR